VLWVYVPESGPVCRVVSAKIAGSIELFEMRRSVIAERIITEYLLLQVNGDPVRSLDIQEERRNGSYD
jgi:hypothetical protein